MGSYHGQVAAGLPFGYNDSIEGMAYPPDYRPRGPPPPPSGKPLLNFTDQEQLNGFFAGFESNSLASNALPSSGQSMIPRDTMAINEQPLTPHYFISSHTHMQGQPPFVDPNALESGESMFDSNHMSMTLPYGQVVQHTAHALPFANYQTPPSNSHDFFDPLASISSAFTISWPQSVPANNVIPSGARPMVRFGSDSRFQPTGYVPPLGSTELAEANGMQRFEWLEGDAQSSAPDTQPNTQPNTQPPSPGWPRKRLADDGLSNRPDHSHDLIENSEQAALEEADLDTAPTPLRKKRKVTLQTEPENPIAPSQSLSHSPSTPTTPATTTVTKPNTRGKRKSIPTPSPAQSVPTKSSPSSSTKAKRPPAISSSSSSGGGGVRVPLTSDQKRANHTNSEQRRRDQAQRAFARLFDLVPELEQEGKLSQMKKLERVVRKIRELEEGNEECRRRIALVANGVV